MCEQFQRQIALIHSTPNTRIVRHSAHNQTSTVLGSPAKSIAAVARTCGTVAATLRSVSAMNIRTSATHARRLHVDSLASQFQFELY